MSAQTDWIGGLAPIVLATVLMGAALVGGKLAPPLRRRLAVWGLTLIGLGTAGFGAVLVARGLADGQPPVWARGVSMILLVVICLAILAVWSRMRSNSGKGGAR